jgi:uncharacterized protein Usg
MQTESIVQNWRLKEAKMRPSETELMLKGYGLTTAELFYRMPDYRHVLNSYVWQDYDLAPDYPSLFKFIEFWQAKLEGEWRNVTGEFRLH